MTLTNNDKTRGDGEQEMREMGTPKTESSASKEKSALLLAPCFLHLKQFEWQLDPSNIS
jgi:hypothetical protein